MLETALLQVKRLDLDESQHAEVIALRQAVAQCQRTRCHQSLMSIGFHS